MQGLREQADAAALYDQLSLMRKGLSGRRLSGGSPTPSPYTRNDHHQHTEKQCFLLIRQHSSHPYGPSWRLLLPLSGL